MGRKKFFFSGFTGWKIVQFFASNFQALNSDFNGGAPLKKYDPDKPASLQTSTKNKTQQTQTMHSSMLKSFLFCFLTFTSCIEPSKSMLYLLIKCASTSS